MLSSIERPVLVSEYADLASIGQELWRFRCHFTALFGWRLLTLFRSLT